MRAAATANECSRPITTGTTTGIITGIGTATTTVGTITTDGAARNCPLPWPRRDVGQGRPGAPGCQLPSPSSPRKATRCATDWAGDRPSVGISGRAGKWRAERLFGCSVQSTRVMMLSAGSSEITSVACAFPDVLMSTILPPARKMSVSPVIPMNFRAPDRQITSWLSGVECCAPNHPEESETGQFSSRPWARSAGTGRPVDHGRATRVRPHSCRIGCRQHRLYTSGGSTWWRPSQPCRSPVRSRERADVCSIAAPCPSDAHGHRLWRGHLSIRGGSTVAALGAGPAGRGPGDVGSATNSRCPVVERAFHSRVEPA